MITPLPDVTPLSAVTPVTPLSAVTPLRYVLMRILSVFLMPDLYKSILPLLILFICMSFIIKQKTKFTLDVSMGISFSSTLLLMVFFRSIDIVNSILANFSFRIIVLLAYVYFIIFSFKDEHKIPMKRAMLILNSILLGVPTFVMYLGLLDFLGLNIFEKICCGFYSIFLAIILGLSLLGLLLLLYFLPTTVAIHRKHPRTAAITILNIFLGITIIGWVILLVWACSRKYVNESTNISQVTQVSSKGLIANIFQGESFFGKKEDEAVKILKKKFVNGEISKEEYLRKKKVLEE